MKDLLRIVLLIAVVVLAVAVVWQGQKIMTLERRVTDIHMQLMRNFSRVERCEFVVEKFTGGRLADIAGWKSEEPSATARP